MMNFISNNFNRLTNAAFVSLLCIHVVFGWISLRYQAPTADEYSYISSAYLYVKTGDFRLDRTHPPLLRLLMGIPLQFVTIKLPPLQEEKWSTPEANMLGYSIGWEMMLGGENNWRLLLTVARIPILILSIGLGVLLFIWARELYGKTGALTVLFLYTLSPNMLAHASLATMDLGISFFFTAMLYSLYRYLKHPRMLYAWITGIVFGFALAAKVTAVLLIAPIGVSLFYHYWRHRRDEQVYPTKTVFKHTSIMICSALFTLFIVYGYPFKPFYYWDTLHNVLVKSTQAGGEAVAGMPHANHAFYLLGEYSTSGWFYYYFAAFLMKTPLAFLGILFVSILFSFKRRFGMAEVLIFSAIAVLLLAGMMNRVNIGIRHVLPLYPLLFIYAGRVALLQNNLLRGVFVPVLLLWYLAASVWISPHYLAYFNEAVGGPQNAPYLLDDSNIDWGQDLAALNEVQHQYPNEPLYVATNWIFNPPAFGVEAELLQEAQIPNPPKGIVAVGKHWAVRQRLHPRSPYYFDWFEKYKPVGSIGHSILLYRFD
jgi:4-amino-4-deoxy-L-arabinose transferase-like glycosyltransferase